MFQNSQIVLKKLNCSLIFLKQTSEMQTHTELFLTLQFEQTKEKSV